jgi:hypothetical protein
MKPQTNKRLKDLVLRYDHTMQFMEHDAAKSMKEDGRAYGGVVRMMKGKMQEFITEELIRIAWESELGQDPLRLAINSDKIRIPLKREYVQTIRDREIKDYILANLQRYYYGLSVDKHVFIDGKMILGIECKAYTENAMIKRILVDFHLLKTKVPKLLCYLFQLESQLGGDYSTTIKSPKGSTQSHTIMSYFGDVDLRIVTLLSGDRKVDQPINKAKFFKPLTTARLEVAVEAITAGFKEAKVV